MRRQDRDEERFGLPGALLVVDGQGWDEGGAAQGVWGRLPRHGV